MLNPTLAYFNALGNAKASKPEPKAHDVDVPSHI